MAIIDIPGFYYDEDRKKYFKITNGGVPSQYHNNVIQAKKRRIEFEREIEDRNNSKAPTSLIGKTQKVHKEKLSRTLFDLKKVRLGFCQLDKLAYDYETTKGWHFWKSLDCNLNKIWGKFKYDYILGTLGYTTCIFRMEEASGTLSASVSSEDLKIANYYQELLNRGFRLLEPEINVFVTNRKLSFKYVTFKVHGSEEFVGIVKLERQTSATIEDLTMKLVNFVLAIHNKQVKEELMKMFGINLMSHESVDYAYTKVHFNTNFKITSALFHRNQLIIGSQSGNGYLFDFNSEGNIYNFRRFSLRKCSICKIIKKDDIMFVSGSKDQIFIFGKNLKVFKVVSHNENIKDFHVQENNNVIVVGLKSIRVYNYKDPHSKPVKILYFNDNITNQISLFDENFFMVNQSNKVILLVHYSNYETTTLSLGDRNRQLVDIIKLSPRIYVVHWNDNGKNDYDLYKV